MLEEKKSPTNGSATLTAVNQDERLSTSSSKDFRGSRYKIYVFKGGRRTADLARTTSCIDGFKESF